MDKRLQDIKNENGGNYLLPFFWMHGEDEALLIEELDRIEQSGIKSVCLESRTHEDFCKEGWWKTCDALVREAKKRGMTIWILDDKHFPTGYANGLMSKYPERRKWHLVHRHVDVSGPQRGALLLDRKDEDHTADERQLVAAVAYRRAEDDGETITGEPIILTDKIKGSLLYWTVPEGCWRVFLIYQTHEGAARPDYIHMIDPDSVDVLIEAVYEPHYKRYGEEFGKTIVGFFSDEPCFANGTFEPFENSPNFYENTVGKPSVALPWRKDMLGMLTEQVGEDAIPLLPLLWCDGGEKMGKIRVAYMDIVTKLYRDCFSKRLGDWCRAHGVEYIGHIIEDQNCHTHMGAGAGHYFRSLEGQDMAGIDIVLQQILPGMSHYKHTAHISGGVADATFYDYLLTKLGVSLADIHPHMKGRVMCENYGAYGWLEGVPTMKWLTDHTLVRGVNCFVPHAFSTMFPNPDCPPHFYARGNNPQFRDFGLLMGYTNKMCHILSGGKHIVSAAILYHAEAEWSGEDFMYCQYPAKALYDCQMDYDILPSETLLTSANINNGKMVVNQTVFPCLIVPYAAKLPQYLLDKLDEFITLGLPVIFVGGTPERSLEGNYYTAPSNAILCNEVAELPKLLLKLGCADIQLEKTFDLLRVFHITRDNSQIVMLFNEDMVSFEGNIRLTCNSEKYTGKVLKADLLTDTYTELSATEEGVFVNLAPYESCLLIYGDGEEAIAQSSIPFKYDSRIELTVFDISLKSTPEDNTIRPYQKAATLQDITACDGMQEFCGVIRYETDFTLTEAKQCYLDLGDVGETAHVWVNDIYCGARICAPYRLNISNAVKLGENHIVIEVANSMAYKMKDHLSRGTLIKASGLLGPVFVEFGKK